MQTANDHFALPAFPLWGFVKVRETAATPAWRGKMVAILEWPPDAPGRVRVKMFSNGRAILADVPSSDLQPWYVGG